MRTIYVLFDSLNRLALGTYGSSDIETPNFDRFAKKAKKFNTHYVGSLPCMPARRDHHTGRLNFTHRSWGPLEPFDNSYAEILSEKGIYTHLISDHAHYFENGGWGYANRFDSWDFIRGQEGDPIKVFTVPPIDRIKDKYDIRHYPLTDDIFPSGKVCTERNSPRKQYRRMRHAVNELVIEKEEDYPTAKCFSKAFEFLENNKHNDNWFLQLECFDPHEPFSAPERFKEKYGTKYQGKILNWPMYEKCTNSQDEIDEIRANYAALVSMCDEYFGKLLDWMDKENAWKDTSIILSTDHGYLLGEHEWWAKNRMPYYEEISHIPLIIWHPDITNNNDYMGLTQAIDLMPTFLDIYGIVPPEEVCSYSLLPALYGEVVPRTSAILGMFAGPICATDGRYTYFHFPKNVNSEMPVFTIMPSHMVNMFSAEELKTAKLVEPFQFSKEYPMLRINISENVGESGRGMVVNWESGSVLYDLKNDPKQESPLNDQNIINLMISYIRKHLEEHDAPQEAFLYYGL